MLNEEIGVVELSGLVEEEKDPQWSLEYFLEKNIDDYIDEEEIMEPNEFSSRLDKLVKEISSYINGCKRCIKDGRLLKPDIKEKYLAIINDPKYDNNRVIQRIRKGERLDCVVKEILSIPRIPLYFNSEKREKHDDLIDDLAEAFPLHRDIKTLKIRDLRYLIGVPAFAGSMLLTCAATNIMDPKFVIGVLAAIFSEAAVGMGLVLFYHKRMSRKLADCEERNLFIYSELKDY